MTIVPFGRFKGKPTNKVPPHWFRWLDQKGGRAKWNYLFKEYDEQMEMDFKLNGFYGVFSGEIDNMTQESQNYANHGYEANKKAYYDSLKKDDNEKPAEELNK